ncbi:MAG: NAD(P)/FAD-dependent oxidoreductase [Candidatus Omnitrophica bacterium]|nr:NAD(P)/FAD-dependent oxidoreductase [Candidatus Omnitrophota bacterium]
MKKYDVTIIGSGIGGLICGCYLTRSNVKTLILEKHDKPGGYCTSFVRNNYIFDVGAHCLGSFRQGGAMSKILEELGILHRLELMTSDVVDIINMPEHKVYVYKDPQKTITSLMNNFPNEKDSIHVFFEFIRTKNFLEVVSKTKKISFQELLDHYFVDNKLKAVLSVFLGNIGVSPSRASALVSIVLFKEFIFDGGYYPKGGMQKLPDLLCERFLEYGGEIAFSSEVTKIFHDNSKVRGVFVQNKGEVFSDFVVSNIDATTTLTSFLGDESNMTTVTSLKPSSSAFVVYLGLKQEINLLVDHFSTWYFSDYDVENCYSTGFDLLNNKDLSYLLCTFPTHIDKSLAPEGKGIIRVFLGSNYETRDRWQNMKDVIYNLILSKLNKLFPNIESLIETSIIGTPATFQRYTGNRDGALFGWEASSRQIDQKLCSYRTKFPNLFLTGHWVMSGLGQSGISVVALSGKKVAKEVIKGIKKGNS